ncbi:hypothetical protein ACFB49_44100 [Sphingomonas sp. DBB INV C78]
MANGLLGRLVDKFADYRQRDIGFEQRDADFAHGRADVCFVERATATQTVEYAAKPLAQTFEHRHTPAVKTTLDRLKRKIRRRAKPRRPACTLGRFSVTFKAERTAGG